MRKYYTMMLALVLSVLGAASVNAADQFIELDARMFRAWDGYLADAKPVAPQSYVGKEDQVQEFACENNLGKELGAGSLVYGNGNVYYKWYANLTGTKKIYIEGTAGVQLRILMNRPEPTGSDPNGGTTVEKNITIGSDGKAELDVSDLKFVHLNAIKTGWGSPAGTIDKIQFTPTGWVSLIYNGSADENDDVESFPVSYDGPNNDNHADERPTIVEDGKDGKAFKITSFDNPTETWHTQFFFLSNWNLEEGTKIRLSFDVRADKEIEVTTSAQAAPRQWNGGFADDYKFTANTQWQHQEVTYTVTAANYGNNGFFKSIAFDLNGGKVGPTDFYFDNIVFEKYIPTFNAEFGASAIQILFPYATNIKDLVKAGGKARLQYPNESVTLKVNGQPAEVWFVEADENGTIYVFPTEDVEMSPTDNVEISFTNPADEALKVAYADAEKGAIEVVEVNADWNDALSYVEPSSFGDPVLVSVTPEDNSFNLPNTISEFTLTFDNPVDCAALTAKIGSEALTKTPATGLSNEVKLTRTGDALPNGKFTINVTNVKGEYFSDVLGEFDLTYSVGAMDGSEEPETVYEANFTSNGDNANGAGWKVNKDGSTVDNEVVDDGTNLQDANSGAGSRLQHNQTAFASDVLYVAQRESNPRCPNGVALYGIVDEYHLTLEAKTYHVTLDASKWDRDEVDRQLLVQVLPFEAVDPDHGTVIDEAAILASDTKAITPTRASKECVHFDLTVDVPTAGDYVIRMVPGDANGNPNGYADGVAIGNVKVEYIPDVLGIVETKALLTALEAAKSMKESGDENPDYAGSALTALGAKIDEYDGKETVMTAPSQFAKATEELTAATKTMKNHIDKCDSYAQLVQKAFNSYKNNKGTKFENTEVFQTVKEGVLEYCTIGTATIIDETTTEETVVETLESYKKFYEDDELDAAITKLQVPVNLAENFFTEVGLNQDIQQGNCGIAVLVERNRLGARTLMSLGVDEEDELIQAVKNSVTDDDALAAQIKIRITKELYTQLKEAGNTVFQEEDGEGGVIEKSYDMTAFLKNPNIYCVDGTKGESEENIPGWSFPKGAPGLFKKWDPQRGVAGLPEDGAFTTWYGNNRMEQTVEDLPAGIYVVSLCGSDWSNQAGPDQTNPHDINSFVYCKTSDTPAVEEGDEEDRDLNFYATRTIVYGGQWNMDHAHKLGYEEVYNEDTGLVSTSEDGDFFGIPVTDGKLTLGIQFSGDAQLFFQHARLTLVAPAEGYDYAQGLADYEEYLLGVDATKAAPKVRAIELYDLNGRRIVKAQKGLAIVKKVMSDGTVKTEKVVK